MSETKDTQPSRISVSIAPHVLKMYDEVAALYGLDRPGLLAVMVQFFHRNPTFLFTVGEVRRGDLPQDAPPGLQDGA